MTGTGRTRWRLGGWCWAVLAADPAPAGAELTTAIDQMIIDCDYALYRTLDRGFGHREPVEVALELFAAFGVVTGGVERSRITPLGQWALPILGNRGAALFRFPDTEKEVGWCASSRSLCGMRGRHTGGECPWRRPTRSVIFTRSS